MTRYVIRRALWALFAALTVSFITFSVQFLASDPVLLLVGPEASLEDIETLRQKLRLDDPVIIQYGRWLGRVLVGNFGTSLRTGRPVLSEVLSRFPPTGLLALTAFLTSLAVSMPLGTVAATRPGGLLDRLVSLLAATGQAIPIFWLGILLIILFGVQLRWLPISGSGGVRHVVLPAVTLAVYVLPAALRLVRTSVQQILKTDYVRTAVSKGLPFHRVLVRHALRPALVPVIGVLAVQLGQLLGGTVVIEAVFAWPGMGSLAIRSILASDFPVVQGIVLLMSGIFVVLTLVADVLVVMIDPRVQLD